MSSIILGLEVIFPIVIFIGLGYLFQRLHWATETTFRQMNRITFRVLIPTMLFYNVFASDLSNSFDGNLLIFSVVFILLVFGIGWALARKLFPDPETSSVVAQGLYRSSFVLFGMQITTSIYGYGQTGMAAILIAVIIPIFNILAVILFENAKANGNMGEETLKGIVTNPLIIALALGVVCNLVHLPIPDVGMKVIRTCAEMATPIALICLGGTFAFSNIKKYPKELLITISGRLVIVPLIGVSIAIALGVSGPNLITVMVMLASPQAPTGYTMAEEYGANAELSGLVVVLTSVLSIFTMFVWVASISAMGLV